MTRSTTYLVVADDADLLERLRAVGEAAGASVIASADALEARRVVATAWPDVILTADVGPGCEWVRTLPQSWSELAEGERPELPSGAHAFHLALRPS